MDCGKDDKRFCVYFHVCKETGKILYIGSGSISRAHNKHNRNEQHKAHFNKLTVVIIADGLSLESARQLEDKYLSELWHDSMFNKMKESYYPKTIQYEDISKVLYYSESSKTFVRKVGTGSVCGSAKDNGIQLNYKQYKLSRVIYCLYNRVDVEGHMSVQFKDNDKTNLNPSNLILSTKEEVSRKLINLDKRNTSGVTGVWWDETTMLWRVCYGMKGKVKTKYFSTKKYLGSMTVEEAKDFAFNLAVEFRKSVERDIFLFS